MSATLTILVALISQIVQAVLPNLASAQTATLIATIIDTLQKILPDIIKAGEELTTTTKNIIAALKGTDGITPDQWNQLDDFEKQIDGEFDEAAKDEGF